MFFLTLPVVFLTLPVDFKTCLKTKNKRNEIGPPIGEIANLVTT